MPMPGGACQRAEAPTLRIVGAPATDYSLLFLALLLAKVFFHIPTVPWPRRGMPVPLKFSGGARVRGTTI